MSQELQQILDECIERLASGESIESCVAAYPEHREQLLPLLEAAWRGFTAAEAIPVDTTAKARGLYRLNEAAVSRGVGDRKPKGLPFWKTRTARPVAIGLVALVALMGLGSIAAVQSSGTVPGDALYWVKTTRESVQLWMPKSDASRAHMHASLAGERGREMQVLMSKGRLVDAENALAEVRYHLSRSAEYAGVVVSVSRMELPRAPHRITGDEQITSLRITIQQDGQIIVSGRTQVVQRMTPMQQERAEQLVRSLDLIYRAMLAGLDDDPSSLSSPFWRTEPVRSVSTREY
ncbi:MAG: hypothetical protein FJ317_00080 [SAR202 cluster bacterium]|nr:hypothetical protein [SAR202 cluster bacterium]